MKYNSFVNPFISCKTDIINNVLYMHVECMVIKSKTMATMDLQFCMEIFLPRKYTE